MDSTDTQGQSVCLSVAMIARDEDDVIAQSIQSVRAIADEIVVLDTGSTDQTVEIAERLGARVIQAPWADDFSAARNLLLSHCRGKWVLWLDAGERLLEESAPLLMRCIQHNTELDKVYFALLDVPPPESGDAIQTSSSEQIAQPRLMPNRSDIRFEGRVRETILPSVERAGLESSTAPAIIHAHARHHNADRKKRHAQRDLRLIELEKNQHTGSENPRLLAARGEALSNLDRRREAEDVFRQAIGCAEKGSVEMLSAYYGLLTCHDGDCHNAADGPKIQMDICMEALEVFPLDAQLLCALGNYLQAQDQIDLAARAFASAVEHGQISVQVWHLAEIIEIATACWVATLQLQGNNDRAVSVLQNAIIRHPGSERLRRRLIELHVKCGEAEEALALLDGLELDEVSNASFGAAIRGASQAAMGQWVSALAYLQSAYVAGCHEPLCLRWLVVALLYNGLGDDVKPIIQQWQLIEPDNVEPLAYLDAIEKQAVTGLPLSTADGEFVQGESVQGEFVQENVRETAIHTEGRWHRIDSAAAVLDTACPQMPIIGQASTVDERHV